MSERFVTRPPLLGAVAAVVVVVALASCGNSSATAQSHVETKQATGAQTTPDHLPAPNPDYKPALTSMTPSAYLPGDLSFQSGTKRFARPSEPSVLAVSSDAALSPVDGQGSPIPPIVGKVPPSVALARYTDDVIGTVDPKTGQFTSDYRDRLVWLVQYAGVDDSQVPHSAGPIGHDGKPQVQVKGTVSWVEVIDAVTGRGLLAFSDRTGG